MAAVASPIAGTAIALDDVTDQVFAQRVLGDGVAVTPNATTVLAPVSGRITKLFPGGHAFVVSTADGLDVLVHLGLDTSHRSGDGFTPKVAEGDTVTRGDHVEDVELDRLVAEGVDMTTVVVVMSGHTVTDRATGDVAAGDDLFHTA